MSNTLAIGAVTATLRQILSKVSEPLPLDPPVDSDLADATCTARPPDKARTAEDTNQVNIFLYQTAPNAALRNSGMPGTRSGDLTQAPLALNLYYMVTAYGRNFDDVLSHRLLGRAMSLIHDRAILLPSDIEKALPGADLARQFEHVRLTPQPMTAEELSKLWTTFQTPYRISCAYEARVVLIESGSRHSKAAPPVISRGPTNTGNDAVARLYPALPELTEIDLPTEFQPAARLPYTDADPLKSKAGDLLKFVGHDLAGTEVDALFTHRFTQITVVPPTVTAANSSGFQITPPDAPGTWPAGLYSVSAIITPPIGITRTTNMLPLPVAPRIVAVKPSSTFTLDSKGSTTVTVSISPPVWSSQVVSLLVGDLEFPARALPALPATTTDVSFVVAGRGTGTFSLRVRVDGVDSFLVDYTADPLVMDPDPLLQVTFV
jgi:Pvc16 N-terminal domain